MAAYPCLALVFGHLLIFLLVLYISPVSPVSSLSSPETLVLEPSVAGIPSEPTLVTLWSDALDTPL